MPQVDPKPWNSVLLAPAKINIFLRITGKRPDGYHEIHSLMQMVSLFDELSISVAPGTDIEVTTDSPEAPGGPSNIAYRAAERFLERAGCERAVSIDIKKNVPVGAGLGGGSSDAACVLRALNRCMSDTVGPSISDRALFDLAAALGSDVPFFLLDSPAVATGRGEVLRPVDLPAFHYVLVNPGFVVSTASVYGNLDLTKTGENTTLTVSESSLGSPESIRKVLVNDLESSTLSMHPEIEKLKALLTENGALGALMSGSGPTVFGIFKGQAEAEDGFRRISESLSGPARAFLVTGLTRGAGLPGAEGSE